MYRYKRLFVSKLFIQSSKINSMGSLQRPRSAQVTLLGYSTLSILVRNSFGRIGIKEIFWCRDTGFKLSPHLLSRVKALPGEKEQHWRWITQVGGVPGLGLLRASGGAPWQPGLAKAALPPKVPERISTLAPARNGLKVAVVFSPPGAFSEERLRGS